MHITYSVHEMAQFSFYEWLQNKEKSESRQGHQEGEGVSTFTSKSFENWTCQEYMKEVSEKCQKIYTNVKKSYLVILQAIKKIVYISNEDSLYN